jgi:DNA repair exonuclease SbcCD ATPase subunit
MIRRVRLRNWKAFDSLQFEPGPGVNFVVARNGVGKSSLIDGCAWAIFGERSGIDPARMRRVGRAETEASVELELPDGHAVTIIRSFSNATRVLATIDGAATRDVNDVLQDALGADIDFLARALLLNADTLNQQSGGSFHLREHLSAVFGVDDLRTAAQIASKYHSDLEKANTKRRRQRPTIAMNDEALNTQASAFEAEIAALEDELTQAREALSTGEADLREAQDLERDAAQHAAHAQARVAVHTRASELLGTASIPDLDATIDAAAVDLERQLDELRTTRARAQASIALAETSIAALETRDAVCPTCRRPLSSQDLEAARTAHEHEYTEHIQVLAAAERNENDIRNALAQVRALQRQLSGLVEPQGPPPGPRQGVEDARSALDEKRRTVDELRTSAAERRGALNQIHHTLDEHRKARIEDQQDAAAYRLEGVARLTAQTLTAAADRLLAEQIEPLAAEVSSRWKLIFGDRGALQMSPDGTLNIQHNGQRIQFKDFSPGERMVAMLAVRFLTVSVSTSATFMLMDEPLEHLDPANRRVIAAMIARSARPVRQLIVTTYEEPLVRRLTEMVNDVDIRYLTPD